jgi:hypothetical protein
MATGLPLAFLLRNGRTRCATLAVTAVAASVVLLSASSYCVGRRVDPELRFLEPRRAPTPEEAATIYPIEYALRTSDANDVIFLGDSACRHDIDPVAFEKLTGLSAYNLGMLGMTGPQADVITLKAYLTKHPAPRLVVLCLSAISLVFGDRPDNPEENPLPERFVADYGPCVDGFSPASVPFFIRAGALSARARLLVICGNQDVRELPFLDGRLKGETYRTMQVKLRRSRGFWALSDDNKHRPPAGGSTHLEVHADWDSGIRSTAKTCNDIGARLLICFAPIAAEYSNTRDFSQVDRWTRELESSDSHIAVARPIVTPYEPRFMWDAIHLNAAGVAKFMRVVAKDVQSVLK